MQLLTYYTWSTHAMAFSLEVKVDRICYKGLLISWFIFCICSAAIIKSNEKSRYKYMSPYSSLLWVRIHLYFSIDLSYIGDPCTSFRFSMMSPTPPTPRYWWPTNCWELLVKKLKKLSLVRVKNHNNLTICE